MLKNLNRRIRNNIKYMMPNGLRQKLQPRKIQAFCIGTPKTGTTSIAGMFNQKYRVAHEPEYHLMVDKMHQHYHNRLSDDEFSKFLKKHDKRVWFDVNSSCFLGYQPDLLFRTFPYAKYILTVREPKSWLESIFNSNICYPPSIPSQARWHGVFFEPLKFNYTRYDAALQEYSLYPIDAFLTYWVSANSAAVQTIPDKQLLILDTKKLNGSAQILANFLEIDPVNLVENSHHNRTEKKWDIINLIDSNYLQDRIDTICSEWVDKLLIE